MTRSNLAHAITTLVAAVVVPVTGAPASALSPSPPELRLAYTTSLLSSQHKVLSDIETPGHQGFVGLGVAATATHLGPVSFGLTAFAARSHGDEPAFVQLELGAVLQVDIGRAHETIGVALRVHPVLAWWITDGGQTYSAPGPASVIAALPQLALLIGSERTWVELGGGGAANGLDPRIGHLTVHWATDARTDRFEVGLALLTAPFISDFGAGTDYVYLGVTGGWWHALTDEVGIGLAVDIAPPDFGLRVTLTHALPL
ncbi:MAG: hypothetical protein CVU56_10845 [Deltaproteobacteria bacterium HGW-Deltaproteobacteria-14]|jgi:hypothetical protein|nr:MAG: hypothetical protein CVU56_10845 [Deltaproteobacteria bacterium HGW-Deltaproteobacteria-14]